jgi:hypothetical protein
VKIAKAKSQIRKSFTAFRTIRTLVQDPDSRDTYSVIGIIQAKNQQKSKDHYEHLDCVGVSNGVTFFEIVSQKV